MLDGTVALAFPISRRLLGAIMAFGGVLINAVAFELGHEAFETSADDGGVALGHFSRPSERNLARRSSNHPIRMTTQVASREAGRARH